MTNEIMTNEIMTKIGATTEEASELAKYIREDGGMSISAIERVYGGDSLNDLFDDIFGDESGAEKAAPHRMVQLGIAYNTELSARATAERAAKADAILSKDELTRRDIYELEKLIPEFVKSSHGGGNDHVSDTWYGELSAAGVARREELKASVVEIEVTIVDENPMDAVVAAEAAMYEDEAEYVEIASMNEADEYDSRKAIQVRDALVRGKAMLKRGWRVVFGTRSTCETTIIAEIEAARAAGAFHVRSQWGGYVAQSPTERVVAVYAPEAPADEETTADFQFENEAVRTARAAYEAATEAYANDDGSNWENVKNAYETTRAAYVAAMNVRMAEEAIETAQTVSHIIANSLNMEGETVYPLSDEDVAKVDALLAKALELRDIVAERGIDAQLLRKVDGAVAFADAGWLVCRPS